MIPHGAFAHLFDVEEKIDQLVVGAVQAIDLQAERSREDDKEANRVRDPGAFHAPPFSHLTAPQVKEAVHAPQR